MARLPDDRDRLFDRMNSSLEFDRRLWPQDVAGSRAHVEALREAEVISPAEAETLLGGLDQVAAELEAGEFPFDESDEDIHMAIERRLTELVGDVGGKLHTGRSRNDQVATDLALYVRERCERAQELIGGLMARLLEQAEAHADAPLPGYTHQQRAQPVYLGHHLLAYFWMLRRDATRFEAARGGAGEMPLGSGALAGTGFELDRAATAERLGFDAPSPNSIDAVASRDAALGYLGAAAVCATHLSRLGGELVLWSSEEFGFCEPADEFSSGSSLMPQKKNPDIAELMRAKAPRVVADFATLAGALHGLPLAYSKDLQEDKEALFDAVDTLELTLEAAAGLLAGLRFDRERMAEAASDEFLAATELADLLVRRGVPFRDAHGIVGGLVREALERGVQLSELEPERVQEHSELLVEGYSEALRTAAALESKRAQGGTSSERLAEQLEAARAALGEVRGG